MLLARLQHIEGLAESKFAHDVEGVVVEPETRVERLAAEGFQLVDEHVGE